MDEVIAVPFECVYSDMFSGASEESLFELGLQPYNSYCVIKADADAHTPTRTVQGAFAIVRNTRPVEEM